MSDIYGPAYDDDPKCWTLVSRLVGYAKVRGRQMIMVSKLGRNGHDRCAKVIASAFGIIGFDVLARL